MTEELLNRDSNRKNSPRLYLFLIAFALVLGGITVSSLLKDKKGESTDLPGSYSPHASGSSPTASEPQNLDPGAAAIAELQRNAFLAKLNKARKDLAAVKDLLTKWEDSIVPLYTSDDGRFIASEENFVRAFQEYYEKKPAMGIDAISLIESSLDVMAKDLEQESADKPLYIPPKNFEETLADAESQISEALSAWQDAIDTIESLLSAAKTKGVQSNETIEEAIETIRAENAKKLADSIAELQRKAEKKEREAQEDAEKERLARDSQMADQARKDAEAKDKHEMFLSEAKAPSRLERFSAILEKGEMHITAAAIVNAPDGRGIKRHHSLTGIQKEGYLSSREKFAELICRELSWKNDRPGGWPSPTTEKEWKNIEDALEEFKKYANYWVELGYLKP